MIETICIGVLRRNPEYQINWKNYVGFCRSVIPHYDPEIDLDAGLWVIPAHRMKAQKEHQIPRSIAALAVLKAAHRLDDLVFAGRDHGKPLSNMSLTAVLRRIDRRDITVHGFRSTFRDVWRFLVVAFVKEAGEMKCGPRTIGVQHDHASALYRTGRAEPRVSA